MSDMLASLGWVDGTGLAVLALGVLLGAKRGLSHELAVFVGYALAVLATRWGYVPLADWMAERVSWSLPVLRFIAVVAVMALAIGAMGLVRMALGTLMSFAFKGLLERVGGAIAGGLRYGLLFLVGLMLFYLAAVETAVHFPSLRSAENAILESFTGQRVLPVLFDAYNELAVESDLPTASRPAGVEAQQNAVVLPPLDGENDGDGGFPAVEWGENW